MPIVTARHARLALLLAAGALAADAAAAETIEATFACDADKSIEASFDTGTVNLKLSDGRTLTLPQTPSAGGARYANADDSVVFWNTGDTANLTEGSSQTYAGCVAK